MKHILIIFALIFTTNFTAKAQEIALPGIGLKEIRLNSPIKDLYAVIGEAEQTLTKEIDGEIRRGEGDRLENDFSYALEYDKVHYFSQNDYGINRVLTRNGKIILMSHNVNHFNTETQNISVENNVKMGDKVRKMLDLFGRNCIIRIGSLAFIEYVYLNEGVCFRVSDKKVNQIVIFEKQTGDAMVEVKEEIQF